MEIRRNRQESLDMLEGRIPAPECTMLAFDDWRFAQTAAQVHQLVGGSGMKGTLEFYTFVPACQNGLAPPSRKMDPARKLQNRATHIPTYYNGIVPPLTARREAEIETVRRLTMAARGRDFNERPGHIPNSGPPLAGSAQDEDDDVREGIAASLAEMRAEQDHNDIQAAIAASLAEMKAAQNNRCRNQHQKTRPDPAPRPHPPVPPSPKSDEDSDTQAAIAASLSNSREDPDTQAAIAASMADMREQKRKKPASPKRQAWNTYTPRSQNQAASTARPATARSGTNSNPPRPPRTPPRPDNTFCTSSHNASCATEPGISHPSDSDTDPHPSESDHPWRYSKAFRPSATNAIATIKDAAPQAGGGHTSSYPRTVRPPVVPSRSHHRPVPVQRGAADEAAAPAVATPAPIPGRSDRRLYPQDPTTGQFLSDADWDAQIM
ncbi:hypothetical protein GE09DRAFT_1212918 [Coniochaeta sp. 2T2.1]|nr:hypothetical protein GE09DRAFT_1212918 [Coniochaeta sp. 2T2.1]